MPSEIRVDTIKNSSGLNNISIGNTVLTVESSVNLSNIPFYQNGQNITSNFTVPSNVNAMTAGPVAITTNTNVSILTGGSWKVI